MPNLPIRSRAAKRRLAPATASKLATLDRLPVELLELVTSNLDRPKDVVRLGLTCNRLQNFVKLYGYEAFLKGRFALLRPHGEAEATVHGLTTLFRNWDKKAFTARYLEPSANVTSLNSGEKTKWRGPQGQTMGYQPSLDSYEEMHGAWSDRRGVLAWSAGTNVVMQVKETGHRAVQVLYQQSELKDEPESQWRYEPGMYGQSHAWYTYKIPGSSEGRDDITALKLLRPHQKDGAMDIRGLQDSSDEAERKDDESEVVVFGTASGRLSMLSTHLDQRGASERLYETNGRPVGSIDVSAAPEPLVAASLGDISLALYSTNREQSSDTPIAPLSQVQLIAPAGPIGLRVGRIWSSTFISNDKVAIGLGPSYEPIHVYEITPDGFLPDPLRKFNFDSLTDGNIRRNTSVYPIIPIPAESQGGSEANHVFLSGAYDGMVRLHDLRSPRSFEALFWDVTNDSSVYSLANQGLERFVVGSSMHSMLKVFDLRFSGSHAYHNIPIPESMKPKPKPPGRTGHTYNAIVSDFGDSIKPTVGGWNLFLSPRNSSRQNGGRHPYRPGPRTEDSPVYSLSIPSPYSSNLYAGLEGTIVNLNFVSVLDPHSETAITTSLANAHPETVDLNLRNVKEIYNPYDDVLNLGMYEQGDEEGLDMQLLVQDEVGEDLAKNEKRKDFAKRRGLDERWKDPGEEGEKWARGQEPQGQVGQGSAWRGGHRGRWRGRGRGGRRAG
ncbi:hypothetical protein BU23DRAFT_550790 [Bimuria novae-zelandiae CBS 107.79]|uniref:F-box domain-containing protein n=1 Tax=Bimuria novae-zelandiae CBS 107.79 TaxID=1447943 RepID=A0A6A5VP36_9PLEO|nr:hypothetical protein BU23DRAFT_550790 [Bimuria novae-zelandiae CBS 107.79]